MSGSDDLKVHATSNQDFYALLDIPSTASDAEIRRAYRRTALKYHPDKIANPVQQDFEKFHLLQIANDVLSDPAVRTLYDNAREARMRKQREREMLDATKRQMRDDLEARERAGAMQQGMGQQGVGQPGVKRPWAGTADDDAEAKLQQELDRIAEDGRKRRREAAEKLKRELEEEKKIMEAEAAAAAADPSTKRVDRSKNVQVSELDRSVKVRWAREGPGLDFDGEWLAGLFGIENTFMLKDKRVRVEGKKGKVTFATGVVVFASIVSAHAAVIDGEKKIRQSERDWTLVESVAWASGQKPDLEPFTGDPIQEKSPATPQEQEPTPSAKPTEPSKPSFNFPGLNSVPKGGKAPAFGSFASAAGVPKASSFDPAAKAPGTPSMEETMLMRLKTAQLEKERKALEEQLAKEDEAADAEEAAAAKANGN
ncbi:hypothetical protein N7470_008710 [Penicillium chermesinum]|nr:hypothetical protein N7470_008710 [Penicillium chermesinum]